MFIILYNIDLFAIPNNFKKMFVETVKTALHLEACILSKWNDLQKGRTE